MSDTLSQWWTGIQKVINYPLVDLGDSHVTLNSILKLLVLVGLVLVAERYLRRILRRRVLAHTRLEPDLQYAVSRFAGYCFIAVGFFFALKAIHLDLSAFAVIVGGLGIGVGFGLQNVVSNFVSGLIILAERPIALGHRIEVGSVAGQVTRINLRSTTVVTNDNITIIVPNSNFITNAVTNWSHGDPKVRLRLPVGVAYGSDVEKLRSLLLEVAAENAAHSSSRPPRFVFLGLATAHSILNSPSGPLRWHRARRAFAASCISPSNASCGKTRSKSPSRSATCICVPEASCWRHPDHHKHRARRKASAPEQVPTP